jgi:hypothetical protein
MNELILKALALSKDGLNAFLGDAIKMSGAAILALTLNWLRKYRQPSLKLLGLSVKGRWSVYFGNVKTGDHGTSAFDTKNFSYVYGDMEATLRVVETMAELINSSPSYHRALHDPKSIDGSVISIGGPKWNKATEYLIGKLGSPVFYKEGQKSLLIQKKNSTSIDELKFSEVASGSATIVRDYGVILVGKKEYFENFGDSGIESVCVLMGYSTVGVRVAAEYLRKLAYPTKMAVKQLLNERLPKKSNRFCIIVVADIQLSPSGEYIDHTEVSVDVVPESDFKNSYAYNYA